jgi:hypothetical protein
MKVLYACVAVAIVAATVPVLSRGCGGGGGAAGNWPELPLVAWPVWSQPAQPVVQAALLPGLYNRASTWHPRRHVAAAPRKAHAVVARVHPRHSVRIAKPLNIVPDTVL